MRARGQAQRPDHPGAAGRTARITVPPSGMTGWPGRTGSRTNEEGREPRPPPGGPGARPRRVVPRGGRRLASSLRAGDPRKATRSCPTADDSAPATSAPRGGRPFPALPDRPDLPAIEREMLVRWRDGKVFERSLEQTAGGPPWTFYEGPPTANGMPGVHHVEARVFKDVFPRFKTMQGFHVPRRAGWDCHGLPVEVAVEKELGLSGKKDIEAYGIAEFNARCRESVLRHVDAFERTDRADGLLGRPVQGLLDHGRQPTSSRSGGRSRQIFDQGLLVRDYRISPYCPRCGTPLSDHEMGQPDVYQTVGDPSVTVRFPLVSLPEGASPELAGADLLVWTTTPWTLVSNTAVAVHPDETYVVARKAGDGGRVVVAEELMDRVLGEGWQVVDRVPGSAELAGATYRPPFGLIHIPDAHIVVTGDVRDHRRRDRPGAPGAGVRRRRHGDRPGARPAGGQPGPAGRRASTSRCRWSAGCSSRTRTRAWSADLAERGLLFRTEIYEHSYPHCWRCGTPLLYYAVPSWYIRTTRSRTSCWPRTSGPTGSRPRSSTAATASGCATTWTGRCPGPGTGGRRCRCGRAPTTTSPASARWPSCPSWPAATCPAWTRTGRRWTR